MGNNVPVLLLYAFLVSTPATARQKPFVARAAAAHTEKIAGVGAVAKQEGLGFQLPLQIGQVGFDHPLHLFRAVGFNSYQVPTKCLPPQ